MRKTVWLLLLALLSGPAACRRANNKKTIAVIPKGTDHLFWQSIQRGALAAGKSFGVQILWNGPARETDFSRQIEILDSMITNRVDGIAISAADRHALNTSLRRAASNGIPVTIFDSGADSPDYLTFLATNNEQAGETAARKLAELLGGKGKIALVMHVPGSESTVERETRFQRVIAAEFPRLHIVAKQFGMSDRARAVAAAENILTAHPDLDGFFASSEASTIGTALALKARGLTGRVRLVGFDVSEQQVADLRDGTIDALLVQNPFCIGYQAVQTLVDKLEGRTLPRIINLQARVVARADLAKPEIQKLLFPPDDAVCEPYVLAPAAGK